MRRFLIVAGTQRYRSAEELPSVPGDLAEIDRAFATMGYDQQVQLLDPATDELRRRLGSWARETDRGDDALVVYYTGHGERDGTGHFLLCADSEPGGLVDTALRTEDIAGILTSQGVRRLLVIVDTCYAEAGTAAAVRNMASLLKAELVPQADGERREPVAFAVIAAARHREPADEGVFARALRAALDHPEFGGQRQPHLHLSDIVDHVNRQFDRDGVLQHATYSVLAHESGFGFLPNPRFAEELPPEGTDLAEQSVQAKLRSDELAHHFGPRGRGTDTGVEPGHYFVGRVAMLRELVGWLHGPADRNAVVVTGSPGAGKSAVLGRLVVLSDSASRATIPTAFIPDGTDPGPGTIDIAIHARHKTVSDLVEGIAAGAGVLAETPNELFTALQGRTKPLVIVVDALDEAGTTSDQEPNVIATQLLRPLARVPGVRLLVGTRPAVVEACGPDFQKLDLDEPQWITHADLARYAELLLLAPHGPGSTSVYDRTTARPIAERIAETAYPNYLVTRLTARALAARGTVVPLFPGWERTVLGTKPTFVPAAGLVFRRVLAYQLGEHEHEALELLTPLAFAEGAGLPWGAVWPAVASAMSEDRTFTEADIRWLLEAAGEHIVEVLDHHNRSIYRLYHESFADQLRADAPPNALNQLVNALLALVPDGDWSAADPYLYAHLATHAAACGRLDALMHDPGFLLTAEHEPLLRSMATLTDPEAVAARFAYERCVHMLRSDLSWEERASALHLSAVMTGARRLAAVLAQTPNVPWLTRWADIAASGIRQRSIGLHDHEVTAVAATHINGVPSVVTGDDAGGVRVWSLSSGELTHQLLGGQNDSIRGIATLATQDGELIVTLSTSGTLVSWYPTSDTMVGPPIETDEYGPDCLAVTQVDGDPIAAHSCTNQLFVRNLRTGRLLFTRRLTLSRWRLQVLKFVTYRGRQVLITAGTRVPWLSLLAYRFKLTMFALDGKPIETRREKNLTALDATDFDKGPGIITQHMYDRRPGGRQRLVQEIRIPGEDDMLFTSEATTLIRRNGMLLAATLDTNKLALRDVATGRNMGTVQISTPEHHRTVKPAALEAEGANWVVVPAGKSAQAVDIGTLDGRTSGDAKTASYLTGPTVDPLSKECNIIAVVDESYCIVYNLETGARSKMTADLNGRVRAVFPSHSMNWPATSLLVSTDFNRKVTAHAFAGEHARPLWHRPEPRGTHYSTSYLVRNILVVVWKNRSTWWRPADAASGEFRTEYVLASTTLATGDAAVLFVRSFDTLISYDIESGRRLWTVPTGRTRNLDYENGGMTAGWLEDLPVVITRMDRDLVLYDPRTGQPLGPRLTGHVLPPKVIEMGQLHDQPVAISGGADRTIRLWNLTSMRQAAVIDVGDTVNALRFGPNESIIVGTDVGLLRIDISPDMPI